MAGRNYGFTGQFTKKIIHNKQFTETTGINELRVLAYHLLQIQQFSYSNFDTILPNIEQNYKITHKQLAQHTPPNKIAVNAPHTKTNDKKTKNKTPTNKMQIESVKQNNASKIQTNEQDSLKQNIFNKVLRQFCQKLNQVPDKPGSCRIKN
eukprot:TRINITY_DN2868_c2_g1_i8.p3 TRINITY_DN2868_c2_g1~~TRINITY_DN2868_c2_g1_i8.p3  ORF type:complete len:151 (+),score=2.66 TRINITY_DN2868_c2_g1_i8:282-734(+)